MNLRGQARADQIIASLRDAEGPMGTTELYHALGRSALNGWGLVSTVNLLLEMKATGRLDVAAPTCCGLHAAWILPADV